MQGSARHPTLLLIRSLTPYRIQQSTLSRNNLNLRIETKPVVLCIVYTIVSTPSMTVLVFVHRYRNFFSIQYTVTKVVDFPRYNIKCCGENMILQYTEYFMYVVSHFPIHFMLYRGNLDYFLDSRNNLQYSRWHI